MSAPLSTSYRSASGTSHVLPAMPSPDDVSTVLPVESCAHELRKAVGRGEPAGLQVAASPEGIVSAIGIIYLAGCSHRPLGLHLRGHCQPHLGETVIEAPEDEPLARRVLGGFRRNTSPQDAKRVLYACMSDSPLRAQLVLTFMRRGFDLKEPLYHHRAEPALVDVFELAYTVSNECEHARQFVRFHRLTSGVYYARFEPSANVIPLVMGHFSARFNTQPFLIHDPRHNVVGFWDGNATQLVQLCDSKELSLDTTPSEEDRYYHTLWKRFYDSVSIDARTNPDLRRKFMPKRFWKNLSEMSPFTDPVGPTAQLYQLQAAQTACRAALEQGGGSLGPTGC